MSEMQYVYTDQTGKPLYTKTRKEPKSFLFSHQEEGRTFFSKGTHDQDVLYNLHEVANAEKVYFVEGEKDVETLRGINLVATTADCGAGSAWKQDYQYQLRGKSIIFIPDNDDPGIKYIAKFASEIFNYCYFIKILILPLAKENGDTTDWFDALKNEGKDPLTELTKLEHKAEIIGDIKEIYELLGLTQEQPIIPIIPDALSTDGHDYTTHIDLLAKIGIKAHITGNFLCPSYKEKHPSAYFFGGFVCCGHKKHSTFGTPTKKGNGWKLTLTDLDKLVSQKLGVQFQDVEPEAIEGPEILFAKDEDEDDITNFAFGGNVSPAQETTPCPDILWDFPFFREVADKNIEKSWELFGSTASVACAAINYKCQALYHGRLYLQAYILLAKSTSTGKRTITNNAKGMLSGLEDVRHMTLSESGQAAFSILGEAHESPNPDNPKAPNIVIWESKPCLVTIDEFSVITSKMGINGNTMMPTLLELFQATGAYSNTKQANSKHAGGKTHTIIDPSISILALTTTEHFKRDFFSEKFMAAGLTNRFFVLPVVKKKWLAIDRLGGIDNQGFMGMIGKYLDHRIDYPGQVTDMYTEEASSFMGDYIQNVLGENYHNNEDIPSRRKDPFLRLHVYFHIFALMYAYLGGKQEIGIKEATASHSIIEASRTYLEMLLNEPVTPLPNAFKERELGIEDLIINYIKKRGKTPKTARQILHGISNTSAYSKLEKADCLKRLIDRDILALNGDLITCPTEG
jgi:hypothetical protein